MSLADSSVPTLLGLGTITASMGSMVAQGFLGAGELDTFSNLASAGGSAGTVALLLWFIRELRRDRQLEITALNEKSKEAEKRREEREKESEARYDRLLERNQALHDKITNLAVDVGMSQAGTRSALRHLRVEIRLLGERLANPRMPEAELNRLRTSLLSDRGEEKPNPKEPKVVS